MLTINHFMTASILVFLIAFSPMSISIIHDTAPLVSTIAASAN